MFKLSSSVFKAIVLCILLHGELSSTSPTPSLDEQCNGHCYKVFKPLLDPLVKCMDDAKLSNMRNEKVLSLEATVKVLQNQLDDKEIQIKDKDRQIEDLRNSTKLLNEISEQLKTQRGENLLDLRVTVKDLQNQLDRTTKQLDDKEIQMKDKDRQIEFLRNTTKLLNEISEQLKTQRDENLPDYCPSGRPNGIYQMQMPGIAPFEVPCESSTPGWTVIQRRLDGSENFKRGWKEYKDGFGDVRKEFFFGLERLHLMTETQPFELYIRLRDIKGNTRYAHYDDFKVGGEEESYKLASVGKFSGNAGDSLTQVKGTNFTTFDRGNQCDATHSGGWWVDDSCVLSMLNGKYYKDGIMEEGEEFGISWGSYLGRPASLTFVQMMIKPKTW